jgi:2-oxoglutarate dehydrogenase E2 component (dihydrolipoamide succinyltransferase)
MSIIEVQVPQLSESVAEGTLATWKKKIGDSIARDEILVDIETDKVVLEVPSPGAGVLVEIIKGDGDTVVSGELIARIDTEAKAGATAPAAEAPKAAAASAPVAAAAAPAGTASPSARKILDEKGVAAADVAGTGRGGRVTKEDAVSAQAKAAAPAGPVAAPTAVKAALPTPATGVDLASRTEQRVPMSVCVPGSPSVCCNRSKPMPS